jgi:hypothetical protein
MDKDIAIIRISRRSGQMIITMKLNEGKWKATDVAVESREDGNQQVTLTSLFSSRAITLLFNEALTKRDVKILGFSSTPDLNRRVWEKVNPNLVAQLPVDEIAQPGFEILDIDFNGSVTKVHARQGNLPLTYILRDHLGQLLVDDIELDLQGRPSSVKATLELLVQVQNYAYDMHENNIRNLQRHSTRDFNELVWRQVDRVPQIGFSIPELLMSRLTTMELNENQGYARLKLGDDQQGATVVIKRQHDEYVIDDIMIHSDKVASRYVSTKKELRLAMAADTGLLRNNQAVQATYTISNKTPSEERSTISIPEVEPAGFEVPQEEP